MKRDVNLGDLLSVIKTDITELINTKFQLIKLEAVEKSSKGISSLFLGLIFIVLISFALLFGFLALAFWLGDIVGSVAGGFGIVVLIYLTIFAIVYICRRPILTALTNLFIYEIDRDLVDKSRNEEKEADYE